MVFSPPFVAFGRVDNMNPEPRNTVSAIYLHGASQFAISGKFIPSEARRRRRHASRGLVLVQESVSAFCNEFRVQRYFLKQMEAILDN